jgi:hypothetical protein
LKVPQWGTVCISSGRNPFRWKSILDPIASYNADLTGNTYLLWAAKQAESNELQARPLSMAIAILPNEKISPNPFLRGL